MTQYMRLQRAETQAETDGPLVFKASTPGTKRDGYDTAALPWRTENYRSNPVITWVHDFAGNRLPIGRADIEVTGGARAGGKSDPEGILAAITFDRADPFAAEVERVAGRDPRAAAEVEAHASLVVDLLIDGALAQSAAARPAAPTRRKPARRRR